MVDVVVPIVDGAAVVLVEVDGLVVVGSVVVGMDVVVVGGNVALGGSAASATGPVELLHDDRSTTSPSAASAALVRGAVTGAIEPIMSGINRPS